ncbi:MAG TPA: TIGR03560 family F420-dependent LLM class oxidoreductase [Candidatus Acidoferrales bacterium]|nr:TIGR03560 family F420-dependent LLM class oxidoreductase [Candidatus Acidoferrales bacterium]
MPLRFGLRLPQDVADFGELRAIAQAAEQLGYHSLWLYDHFYHFPYPDNITVLEPWTLMSVLAGATSTIRFGTMVLCHGYRPPALLAKMAATLDVLSGGRLEIGYGAGWHAEEFAGYGYDFPPIATRIRQMEEGLTVMKRLWTDGRATFQGKHHQLADAICEPKPVQRPHPPITIGGGGERLLLRAVARHADVWNYFPVPLPEFERKSTVLDAHCRALGRDPQTLQRSLTTPTVTAEWEKEVRDQLEGAKARGYMWAHTGSVVQGTPDIVVPRFRDYIRRGVSFFIIQLPDGRDLKQIEFVAKQVIGELT